MPLDQLKSEIATIISRTKRPEKAVVTGGMPYANAALHVGHLAGAHVPPDIYARWLKMFIGDENVIFVCGSDDHGSTSEVSARKAGKDVRTFIAEIHESQRRTLDRYSIGLDVYTGTSREEVFDLHTETCQEVLVQLAANGIIEKRSSEQWYDQVAKMFLPDRFVNGECPRCGDPRAYSDQCDACGATYNPSELKSPVSVVSGSQPILRETQHWWLNMWSLTDELRQWILSKEKTWRKSVFSEAVGTVTASCIFSNQFEAKFKELRPNLPQHKSRYAAGKRVVVQFENLGDLETGKKNLEDAGIVVELDDGWAKRAITRDIAWGIPLPEKIKLDEPGKSFYVWPESLIAPISFSKLVLKNRGLSPAKYSEFWKSPNGKIAQFIGVDNTFFYVVMQGALWLGSQEDPHRPPIAGELQLTDVYANFHLQLNGAKMSKSTGNFYTADQLLDEYGYDPDQIRYFLALLTLSKKQSNFDFASLNERNVFLAGPMNAALEKPISAAIAKFDSVIPAGKLIGTVAEDTKKIVQMYMKFMERAEYSEILFAIENYTRLVNKLFNQFRPHDDRCDLEGRQDALFSSFFILKNLMIMLHPFVPTTMDRLRSALNLPVSVLKLSELGAPIPAGHRIGVMQQFFPPVPTS